MRRSTRLARRTLVGAWVALAALVGASSLAWACLASSPSVTVDPNRAQVGSVVTVSGRTWNGEVAIRWNSTTGPVLATVAANQNRFSVQVTIPDAPPGVYALVAVRGDVVKGAPFEVAAPADSSTGGSAPPSGAEPSSGSTSASTSGGSGSSPSSSGSTSASTSGGSGSPAPSATSGSTSPGAPQPSSGGGDQRKAPGSSPSNVVIPSAPAAERTAAPSTSELGSGATFSGRSPAPASLDGSAAPAAAAAASTPGTGAGAELLSEPAPSVTSVSDDLWLGFKQGLAGGRGHSPSLVDLAGPAESSWASPAVVTLLFLLGLVVLSGGFGLAELSRRRAATAAASTKP